MTSITTKMTRALLPVFLFALLAVTAMGQTETPENSCTEPTACQDNDVEVLEIQTLACNGMNGCSGNTGVRFSAGSGACNNAKDISTADWVGPEGSTGTCSYNTGDVTVGNLGCTGAGACSHNSGFILATQISCSGEVSCSDNKASIDVKARACTGDGSCSQNGDSSDSDAGATMLLRVQENACAGEGSCRNLILGGGALLTIGTNSCTGSGACKDVMAADAPFTIGSNACTEDNSCQGCTSNIPDGACKCDGSPCKSEGSSSNSNNNSGGSSGAGYFGQRHVVGIAILLVGFVAI